MTSAQFYTRIKTHCEEALTDVFEFLTRDNREDDYPYISCGEIISNTLEINIGSKRVLLSYLVNKKDFSGHLFTKEIEPDANNYGNFKLKELPELKITYNSSENKFFDKNNVAINLPNGYISAINRIFDLI